MIKPDGVARGLTGEIIAVRVFIGYNTMMHVFLKSNDPNIIAF